MQGFVLRLPPQNKAHATFMQPLQYVSQHPVANLHLSTHMETPNDNNHAATPMRSATTDPRNALNYAHSTSGTTAAATAAHTRYLSPPPAATLHRKMQGFVLRLPPQNKARATFMQPLQYVSQHPLANLHLSTHMETPNDNNHAATPMRSATTDPRNALSYAHSTSGTTAAATTAHTRYLSSPPAATLHGKMQGFVLRLPPQHKRHHFPSSPFP